MIRVNDRDNVPWKEGMTVAALLELLRYTFPHIIVTVNGEVVGYLEYNERLIPDGADVRVIHLIAGG